MAKKRNKLIIFISFLVILFAIFLFLIYRAYSYEKKYQINGFKITEKYDKKTNEYQFLIQYNNNTYPFIINHQYINKKELLTNIEIFKQDDELCILPESKKLTLYPLCSNGNDIYTSNLTNIKIDNFNYPKNEDLNKNYQKINIHNILDRNYLIYYYKGFYLINSKKNFEIALFNKDIYTINLIYQAGKYVIIPDYEQEYYFDKIYLINLINGKKDTLKLENAISFDSQFLGDYKNKVYLLDQKEEKEYVINLNKMKVEETDYVILENNKLIKKDYDEIVNKKLNFLKQDIRNYQIIDNKLYLVIDNIKVRLSDLDVTRIIKNDLENVYFLSGKDLYLYNNLAGEVLLLSNFEWEFNNNNVIYIA